MKDNFASGIIDVQEEEGNLMRFGCYSGTFYCSVPNSKCILRTRAAKRESVFFRERFSAIFCEELFFSWLKPDCPVFLLVDNGSYRKRKSPFFLLNLLFVQTKSPINFVVLFRFFCAIFKHILHCQIHNVMNERLRSFLWLMLFCTKGVLITV